MITWFGWIGHLGQGLLIEHYSFEFWILVGFGIMMMWLGIAQRRKFWGRGENIFRHTILGRIGGVVGTCSRKPKNLFWYITYFNCYFDFFSTKHGIML